MIESTDEVSVFDPEPVKADGDKPPVQSDATNKVHRKKKKEQLNSEKVTNNSNLIMYVFSRKMALWASWTLRQIVK